MSERFAALNAIVTGAGENLLLLFQGEDMDNIKLYEIDSNYVAYISQFSQHLFHNKQPGQQNERKYIGVVLTVNGLDYFAPLSSFIRTAKGFAWVMGE